MQRPKVFITDQVSNEVIDYISKYCDYEIWEHKDKIPKTELIKHIREVDGVINDMIHFDEEVIRSASKLKVISNMSVGYNNLDIEAMLKHGVIGTNTPGVLNDSVADLIIGMMLAAARRIPEMDQYVKNGHWQLKDYKATFGVDLHHSTVGIIGMGRIGEVVARRLRFGFETEVLYYNRNRDLKAEELLGVEYCEMNELLSKSDFVVLMTPHTKETNKLIGKDKFAIMKQNSIFINASRGGNVDEAAMLEALKSGRLMAAAVDVFEKEPVDPDNELLKLRNFIALPHIGTATTKTTNDMAMLAAINIVEALLHKNPPNLIPEFM